MLGTMTPTMAAGSVTEWTFTGDVQSIVNEILHHRSELGFSEAKIEERGRGQLKRRDLTLYDDHGRCALSGELKMPDKADGRTPYNYDVVEDAHGKADQAGSEYFFTWNVNRFVLWKTFEPGTSMIERDYHFWDVVNIRKSSEVTRVLPGIRRFLEQFLEFYARVYRGDEIVRARPLDERFVHILESALEAPVAQTLFEIESRYKSNKHFESQLDEWMREDQDWFVTDDEEIIRDNLERAAKFSCYVLVNKLVFYTALRRRFKRLPKIKIPHDISSAAELKEHLDRHFKEAKDATHDYETVFDGDFGDVLPFLSDVAVDSWRELLNQIDGFDFTQLDYDIIGHIFERLIGPEERHRYGQHYTSTEIVDLINAFCIRDARARVLDPGCGGGTFLVRAYARKRYLSTANRTHAELLQELKGIDVSAYPAHLSTINLATRQLVDAENYPLIARADFFDVRPDQPLFHVPMGKAGGGQQLTMLQVGEIDAVVGNPPYIRQELLDKGFKDTVGQLVEQEFPGTTLTQRSDIYAYFFVHAASFLAAAGSYLGFLTSIAWLDTEYGFRLQKFFLEHFRIVAVLESSCEPWFTGARVTTAVTILQREPDEQRRRENTVRFVQIRRPLGDLYPTNGSSTDRLKCADDLRDAIESCTGNCQNESWRIRVIDQGDLYDQGCWECAPEDVDDDELDGVAEE
jgi:type I restriction-modification system DNA methylase subunit